MSALSAAFNWLLGGDSPAGPVTWWQVMSRAAVLYFVGIAIVRLGKSRLLSRATPFDVILAFILGSLLSRGIVGRAALSTTIIAAATLVALHWLCSKLAMSSHWLGNLIKGHTYLLVSHGQIDRDNLRRSHLSERDLAEAMRLQANIDDLRDVEAAYKERSGEIGVVRKPPAPRILDVDVRDGVQTVRIVLNSREPTDQTDWSVNGRFPRETAPEAERSIS